MNRIAFEKGGIVMRSRWWSVVGLLIVLALMLTACGNKSGGSAAQGKEITVTIGFTESQTGKYNVSSGRQAKGLRLWMDEVNAAGGIKLSDGTVVKFQAVSYDDESNKDRVQELYTKLATEDNADFLISPYSSGLTAAAAVIAEQYGKVMLTTGAASDATYKQGYTRVFQIYTPASRYLTGAVDMLKALLAQENEAGFDRDTARTVLGIVERATERLQRLTNNLLDIRRLESGQPIARPRPIAPAELIAGPVDLATPLANAKEQQLQVVLEDDLPLVMADPDMVRRVLMNLLENAVKYTPNGGRIEVGAAAAGDQVRFWVRDSGPGIPLEEQEWIFEKYRRASTALGSKGLGLGLAYCRLAVEAHGGQIGVESRPGQGAKFFFTLRSVQKTAADDKEATDA